MRNSTGIAAFTKMQDLKTHILFKVVKKKKETQETSDKNRRCDVFPFATA